MHIPRVSFTSTRRFWRLIRRRLAPLLLVVHVLCLASMFDSLEELPRGCEKIGFLQGLLGSTGGVYLGQHFWGRTPYLPKVVPFSTYDCP
jgi:hypothetical protein